MVHQNGCAIYGLLPDRANGSQMNKYPGWDNDHCDCPVCKSAPHSMTKYSYNKYGMRHHGACMCQKCIRLYSEHNRSRTCACDDCATHRQYLYPPKQQKAKGRQRKMATIAICDTCGSFGKSDVMGLITLERFENDPEVVQSQICPGCVGDVLRVLSGTQDRNRPSSAYTKPYEAPKSDPGTLADVPTESLAKELLGRAYGEDAKE